jgi:hypothetical protein
MALSKRDVLVGGLAAAASGASGAQAAPSQARPSSFVLPNGDAIIALLETTPYVQAGSGERVLYDVGYRACTPCMAFARGGVADFVRAGFAVRTFIFAPRSTKNPGLTATNGEMASVGEVYRTRSAAYLEAWYRSSAIEGFASTRGVPDFATNDAAKAAVEDGRKQLKSLAALLDQAIPSARWGYPAFIWRTQSGVYARFGYGRSRDLLDAVRRG